MRILDLTPEAPYFPGGSGGSTRQFHLLRRLAELGHEVTVATVTTAEQEARIRELEAHGVHVVTVPRPASRVQEALAALGREPSLAVRAATTPLLPWQVGVFWASLRPVAERLIAEARPDAVSIQHDNAAAWALDLPRDLPAALTLHNLGWHYYENRAAAAGGLAGRLHALEARRFLRHDVRAFARYGLLVAMSERDRDDLARVTRTPIEIVPNGVSVDRFRPLPEPDGPPVLLFTGTMNHPPNAEGICWFAERVWPLVLAREPEARLLVVGRDPPERVRRLADDPRIEVTGGVPEIDPWFARAHVALVPLLSGGGTRLKVLEALAFGRAVVSTRVGAEGLDVVDDRDLVLADGPEAFAAATLSLLADAPRRARLAAAGRELVERSYGWDALGDRLASALARLAAP
ncbi:MAG: glycosyltransferase [Thermoleophilia bacterium]